MTINTHQAHATVTLASPPRAANMTDEAILLRYRRTGDHDLFAELVRRYEGDLYAFLYRRCQDATLAEDAFQAAFLKIHLKCDQFEEGRKFRPWLYAIASNTAIDTMRGNRRHQSTSLHAPLHRQEGGETPLLDMLPTNETSPTEHLDRSEREAQCRKAIMQLPEKMNVVVDLIFFRGLKYREAAEVLSIPIGTVKSRVHEAMNRLRATWNHGSECRGESLQTT